MKWLATLVIVFSIGTGLITSGCEADRAVVQSKDHADAGDAATDGDSDSDTDADTDSDADSDSDSGQTCAETNFTIAVRPVDMLIVLDRSNSMCDDGYWDPLGKALKQVIQQMKNKIRFGLIVFPTLDCMGSTQQCDGPVETSEIPRAQIGGSDAWISANLGPGGVGCCGGTPTAETFLTSLKYLDTVNDGYDKYVLLATDGAPNCNATLTVPCRCTTSDCTGNPEMCLDDQATTSAAAELFQAGYPIYVLSIGSMSQWADVMNAIAASGGTGTFYDAQSSDFLDTLNTITGKVVSCDYDVDWTTLPPNASTDPSLVNLYCKVKDTDPVSEDNIVKQDKGCANGGGWDWSDQDTVTFCQDACDKLKSGACKIITATFGCKTVVIQ